MTGLEIMAAAGLATSVYGQIKSGADRAGAQEYQAALKNIQANELLEREAINEQIMREKAELMSLDYGAAFAASGREGAGLGGILKIHKNVEDSIANSRRDAEFKARMLRAGAEIDTKLASDLVSASYVGAGGTILTGVAKAYDIYAGPSSKTRSLPGVKGGVIDWEKGP
jgi:hypothetical protein